LAHLIDNVLFYVCKVYPVEHGVVWVIGFDREVLSTGSGKANVMDCLLSPVLEVDRDFHLATFPSETRNAVVNLSILGIATGAFPNRVCRPPGS
jgi:hypothetical protein